MNGPDHYRAAEVLIEAGRDLATNSVEIAEKLGKPGADMGPAITQALIEAQVHATLALAAASAQNIRRNGAVEHDADGWHEVLR